MIYVVVKELIPTAQRKTISEVPTIGAMLGFSVLMTLDVAMG
jgi:ZIP family zinc transporter